MHFLVALYQLSTLALLLQTACGESTAGEAGTAERIKFPGTPWWASAHQSSYSSSYATPSYAPITEAPWTGPSCASSAPVTTTTTQIPTNFCEMPPTVPDFNLTAYVNQIYYSTYLSGSALFLSGRCITASYKPLPNGSVDVFNCEIRGNSSQIPACLRGIAGLRPGSKDPARLAVSFPFVRPEPSSYNVAAVLGSAETGYSAAAVYSCGAVLPGGTVDAPGFFILSRSPSNAEETLRLLKQDLTLKGYGVDSDIFVPIDQKNCKYFYEPTGFVEGGMFKTVGAT
jgi:lipocalin